MEGGQRSRSKEPESRCLRRRGSNLQDVAEGKPETASSSFQRTITESRLTLTIRWANARPDINAQ